MLTQALLEAIEVAIVDPDSIFYDNVV